MSTDPETIDVQDDDQEDPEQNFESTEHKKEIIEKDFVPHFLPTYRIT